MKTSLEVQTIKESCGVGEPGLISESRRSPGKGNGYPCQYFFLDESMVREDRWATVIGVTKSGTILSN